MFCRRCQCSISIDAIFVPASRWPGPNPYDVRRAPASPPRGGGCVLPAAASAIARGRHRRGLRQRAPSRLHFERTPAPAGDA